MGFLDDIKYYMKVSKRAKRYRGRTSEVKLEESQFALQNLFREKRVRDDFQRAVESGIPFQEALRFVCSCEEEFDVVYYDFASIWVTTRLKPEYREIITDISSISYRAIYMLGHNSELVIDRMELVMDNLIRGIQPNIKSFAAEVNIDINTLPIGLNISNKDLTGTLEDATLKDRLESIRKSSKESGAFIVGTSADTKQMHTYVSMLLGRPVTNNKNKEESDRVRDILDEIINSNPGQLKKLVKIADKIAAMPDIGIDNSIVVEGPNGISLELQDTVQQSRFREMGDIADEFLGALKEMENKQRHQEATQPKSLGANGDSKIERLNQIKGLSETLENLITNRAKLSKFRVVARIEGTNKVLIDDLLGMTTVLDLVTLSKIRHEGLGLNQVTEEDAVLTLLGIGSINELMEKQSTMDGITEDKVSWATRLLNAKSPVLELEYQVSNFNLLGSEYGLYAGLVHQIYNMLYEDTVYDSLGDANCAVQQRIATTYPGLGPNIIWKIAGCYAPIIYNLSNI